MERLLQLFSDLLWLGFNKGYNSVLYKKVTCIRDKLGIDRAHFKHVLLFDNYGFEDCICGCGHKIITTDSNTLAFAEYKSYIEEIVQPIIINNYFSQTEGWKYKSCNYVK